MTPPAHPSVAAVIPTTGRDTLNRAVASVLTQTLPVAEVIVVLDADVAVSLPDDPRVRVLKTSFGGGASAARQRGIDASTSTVIALLDDDDEWRPTKVATLLDAVPRDRPWIAASGMTPRFHGEADPTVVWPRRCIRPNEPVADYLFQFHSPKFGGAILQTSTLCFPRAVAEQVPWVAPPGALHDDPTWLLKVRAEFPDIPIVQVPDSLVIHTVRGESLSRTSNDDSAGYIAWGREHLRDADKRTQGDYFLTSPVTNAMAAGSARGVLDSIRAGVRYGRPGFWAWAYALAAVGRAARVKRAKRQ